MNWIKIHEEEETPIINEKNKKQGIVSIIGNYFKLPKICDWLIVGVIVLCVIATVMIICI
jgi:hypothetical protein